MSKSLWDIRGTSCVDRFIPSGFEVRTAAAMHRMVQKAVHGDTNVGVGVVNTMGIRRLNISSERIPPDVQIRNAEDERFFEAVESVDAEAIASAPTVYYPYIPLQVSRVVPTGMEGRNIEFVRNVGSDEVIEMVPGQEASFSIDPVELRAGTTGSAPSIGRLNAIRGDGDA